jgi:hypothetical protein
MRFTFPKCNKRELKIRNVPSSLPFPYFSFLLFSTEKEKEEYNNRIIVALHYLELARNYIRD